jgi:tRNA G46 methylase TrmB
VLHLRTDDPSYFEQMQNSFAPATDFTPEETPADLAALTTEFERQWNAEGKKTHRVSYRLAR